MLRDTSIASIYIAWGTFTLSSWTYACKRNHLRRLCKTRQLPCLAEQLAGLRCRLTTEQLAPNVQLAVQHDPKHSAQGLGRAPQELITDGKC